MGGKKNVNLDHLIRWLGILFGQREGGETYTTPPVKTLTHESDGTWDGGPSRSRGPNLRVVIVQEKIPRRKSIYSNNAVNE